MVILLSAASCTGKTLLAKRLLENRNISHFSIDHLKMGLFRGDPNCGFTPTDSNEHIGGKLWPILRGIIMTAIENEQDLLIEGCYIFPEYLNDFDEEYLARILPVFICFSEEYIREHYLTGIIQHRQVVEKRDYEEDRSPEVFLNDHNTFKNKCKEYGVNCFEIQSDYVTEMNKVYEFIVSKLTV